MKNVPQEGNIGLLDIVDLKFLQEFQDAFAKSVNVASIIVDNVGPITKPSNFTDFCIKYTRGSKLGYQRCNDCDIRWGQLAAKNGEPVIYNCHSGLTDFAVPIMLNGKHIGSILGGQILTHKPDEEHFRKVAQELGIDETEYIEAIRKIKVIPYEQVEAAAQLSFVVANSISEVAHKNYELLEKNKKENLYKNVMETIRSSFDVDFIKHELISQLGALMNADRVAFVNYDSIENHYYTLNGDEYRSSSSVKTFVGYDFAANLDLIGRISNLHLESKDIIFNDVDEYLEKMNLKNTGIETFYSEMGFGSSLSINIDHKDFFYGYLVITFEEKRDINESDINFIKTLANQVGIALYQANLYEKMEKTVNREVILRKIIEITRSSLNINEVKKQLADELGKTFNADRCYFRSYDKAQDKFSPPDAEYLSSPDVKSLLNTKPDQKALKYFSDELNKRREGFYPMAVNEEFAKGTPLEAYLKLSDIKADYAMPIVDCEDEFTWLVLHYSSEDPNFDDDYKKLLETIAFQIDTAFRQIKLHNTTKKQTEREKAILGNLPFMVWLKDTNGVLLAANEPYARMCNTTVENLIGKTDYDFFPKEHSDLYVAEDSKVMKQRKTIFSEDVILGPDGPRYHETYKTPLFNEEGEVVGTTGFSRDITERKEIDKMKNEFVSMVSHELRTPLTSIRGALGLVISGKIETLSQKTSGLLEIANNNCLRLINLINDILDIEKMEAGKMDFEIITTEIMPLVEQALQSNIQYAQKFGVELKLTNALENVVVRTDSNRLIQVLTNLLSNAIKFSEYNSAVKISVINLEKQIRISVTNHGTEIPAEFKNRIFQKFAQADSSDARQKGGTGLGLSISKAIVEKMGGSINFTSQNNETTFYFDIPEFTDVKNQNDLTNGGSVNE